jgi:hypothetical protein
MTLKKLAICAAALVAGTIASQLAQAGGKGGGPNLGVSSSSPGHIMQSTTPDPSKGASTFAPGSTVKDEPAPRTGGASDIAPGATNPNSQKK